MFTVTLPNGKNYKVNFHHYYRQFKGRKGLFPYKTACFIKCDNTIVSEAMSKPVDEVAVVEEDSFIVEQKYKRKLKRVYPLEYGSCVAIISGDNFNYDKGRRVALDKALAPYDKEDRCIFWEGYHAMLNKAREVSKQNEAKLTVHKKKISSSII